MMPKRPHHKQLKERTVITGFENLQCVCLPMQITVSANVNIELGRKKH